MRIARHVPFARRRAALLTSLAALLAAGCLHIGPQTVERDNLAYGDALGEAWKRQMLLNMVKLRYADPPVFLEVVSVINQYSLEGQVSLNSPGWDRPNNVGPPIGGVAGRWADRPTITYTPLSGERFTRNLMSPIPPVALVSLLQSGWPARVVFGLNVRSVNGIDSGTRAELFRQPPDPRFAELLEALTVVQRSSALGIRIDRRPNGDIAIIVLDTQSDESEILEARRTIRRLLGLDPTAKEFRLEYGAVAGDSGQIAILSRSLLEIIGELSFGIEVPPRHLEEGWVRPAPSFTGAWVPPTIRVHSSENRPEEAYAAVSYQGYWFWIDHSDFASKRLFTFLVFLGSLAESGTSPTAPLITVNTGG